MPRSCRPFRGEAARLPRHFCGKTRGRATILHRGERKYVAKVRSLAPRTVTTTAVPQFRAVSDGLPRTSPAPYAGLLTGFQKHHFPRGGRRRPWRGKAARSLTIASKLLHLLRSASFGRRCDTLDGEESAAVVYFLTCTRGNALHERCDRGQIFFREGF